jgi:hypothetical protein
MWVPEIVFVGGGRAILAATGAGFNCEIDQAAHCFRRTAKLLARLLMIGKSTSNNFMSLVDGFRNCCLLA